VARQREQFGFIWQFVSFPLLKVVTALGLVLLVVGALIWACERRQNPQHFGGNAKGVLSGFWWAAVTMTTVGYGDKVPVTIGGRIIGLLWMFTAIILISGFTASITTKTLKKPGLSHCRGRPAKHTCDVAALLLEITRR
jgi:polar amino acid transport system substrate-binding protein